MYLYIPEGIFTFRGDTKLKYSDNQTLSKRLSMTFINRTISFLGIAGILMSIITGCTKKNDPGSIPTVTTSDVKITSDSTATCGGTVTYDGGSPVTARGICLDTITLPALAGPHTINGTGTGTFTSNLNGLRTDIKYYARAYATNGNGTAYGQSTWFRILRRVPDSVADADGNIYHIAWIARKFWTMENLRVTHYRNGDAIAKVTVDNSWKVLTTGACCLYEDNASNITNYGYLYNWYALADNRGICPTGWHVPSVQEWNNLADSLGGANVAGGKMKSTGTIEGSTGLWYSPNTGGTNSSGFSGVPGGYRINYGTYYSMGNVGYYWSSSDTASLNAWNFILDANNGELNRNFNFKTNGFSVRCCKD